MKPLKKNIHLLTEESLIIFGPKIDEEEVTGLFDE